MAINFDENHLTCTIVDSVAFSVCIGCMSTGSWRTAPRNIPPSLLRCYGGGVESGCDAAQAGRPILQNKLLHIHRINSRNTILPYTVHGALPTRRIDEYIVPESTPHMRANFADISSSPFRLLFVLQGGAVPGAEHPSKGLARSSVETSAATQAWSQDSGGLDRAVDLSETAQAATSDTADSSRLLLSETPEATSSCERGIVSPSVPPRPLSYSSVVPTPQAASTENMSAVVACVVSSGEETAGEDGASGEGEIPDGTKGEWDKSGSLGGGKLGIDRVHPDAKRRRPWFRRLTTWKSNPSTSSSGGDSGRGGVSLPAAGEEAITESPAGANSQAVTAPTASSTSEVAGGNVSCSETDREVRNGAGIPSPQHSELQVRTGMPPEREDMVAGVLTQVADACAEENRTAKNDGETHGYDASLATVALVKPQSGPVKDANVLSGAERPDLASITRTGTDPEAVAIGLAGVDHRAGVEQGDSDSDETGSNTTEGFGSDAAGELWGGGIGRDGFTLYPSPTKVSGDNIGERGDASPRLEGGASSNDVEATKQRPSDSGEAELRQPVVPRALDIGKPAPAAERGADAPVSAVRIGEDSVAAVDYDSSKTDKQTVADRPPDLETEHEERDDLVSPVSPLSDLLLRKMALSPRPLSIKTILSHSSETANSPVTATVAEAGKLTHPTDGASRPGFFSPAKSEASCSSPLSSWRLSWWARASDRHRPPPPNNGTDDAEAGAGSALAAALVTATAGGEAAAAVSAGGGFPPLSSGNGGDGPAAADRGAEIFGADGVVSTEGANDEGGTTTVRQEGTNSAVVEAVTAEAAAAAAQACAAAVAAEERAWSRSRRRRGKKPWLSADRLMDGQMQPLEAALGYLDVVGLTRVCGVCRRWGDWLGRQSGEREWVRCVRLVNGVPEEWRARFYLHVLYDQPAWLPKVISATCSTACSSCATRYCFRESL